MRGFQQTRRQTISRALLGSPLTRLKIHRIIAIKREEVKPMCVAEQETHHLTEDEWRLARMLKALGNPIRFQIMNTLAERQTCMCCEIVETTPLAQSTVSQHLKVLREAGLIGGEVEGPATCYCIDAKGVRWLKDRIEGWLPRCC
jgi:DNA-binding HxlR family transcriptional regulator